LLVIKWVTKHIKKNWLILLEYNHRYGKVALHPVDFNAELRWHVCHVCPLLALVEELDQAKTQFMLNTRSFSIDIINVYLTAGQVLKENC
jgi:hypothetical protein